MLGTIAILGWFSSLARGRMPQGMRDLAVYAIGYSAQVNGFLLLLTDRYPNSDPAIYESANVYRDDPIRVPVDDDLRRSRLTVFFRLLLATPHFVWLLLWTVLAFFVWIANWFATLIGGRSPPRCTGSCPRICATRSISSRFCSWSPIRSRASSASPAPIRSTWRLRHRCARTDG